MIEVLKKLVELAEEGKLNIEGVTMNNTGYSIEIGNDVEHFSGDITLTVDASMDVIKFGNILSEALKEGKNGDG